MLKKVGVAGGTLVAGLIALASISSSICACGNAASNFILDVGADPMKGDPAIVQAKLLEKLPTGSSVRDLHKFAARISPIAATRESPCAHETSRVTCRFPVRGNMWGQTGFELRFDIDSSNRISNAQMARF